MSTIRGCGAGLTIEEPENNIVRGSYYALISALGGAQTMALCCYDEAYTIPTPRAQLISLRTMQIVADEIGLSDTVDPLAGSYYIESLTAEMEKRMTEEMRRVDEMGGMVQAVATGRIAARHAIDQLPRHNVRVGYRWLHSCLALGEDHALILRQA